MKTVNNHEYEYETLKNHRPLLSYETGDSLEEWKAKARAKLEELLGLPLERCDGEAEIEYEQYQKSNRPTSRYFFFWL